MKLTRSQSDYFLGKFVLFYSTAELARLLDVSRATLERWLSGENQPSVRFMPAFEAVFAGLIKRLDQHGKKYGKWASDIADILEDTPYPKTSVAALPPNAASATYRWLHRELDHHKPVKSQLLFKRAAELGFTKSQVNYAAKRLGIVKQQKGVGRGSHSVWRLP